MPGFYGAQLPAFRIPDQSIDFNPLIKGFNALGETADRFGMARIGEAMNSPRPATSSQPPQTEPNRLLSFTQPPSPAQASAAAAGRELPQSGNQMEAWKRSIAGIESRGSDNPYTLIGPATRNGDRAIGKYQVMANNVGPWTQEVFGRAMSPEEFRASPEAQEKLFEAKFGAYVKQTGDPAKAASMWFTGRPDAPNARASTPSGAPLGITGAEYVGKFNAGLGTPAASPQTPRVIPASASQGSGTNYAAGIRTALAQGNLAVATQLMQAQRAEEAAGRQDQLFPYQLEAAQTGSAKDRAELENLATLQMGKVANAIQNAPEASRGAMWQRVIQSHPEMARALAENGVDPNNVAAGTGFFVNMARGLPPQNDKVGRYRPSKQGVVDTVTGQIVPGTQAQADAEFGTTPQYYTDKDGNLKVGQLSKAGGIKPVDLPDGATILPGIDYKDTGTEIIGRDKRTGQVVSSQAKDVSGKAEQTKLGEDRAAAKIMLPAVESTTTRLLDRLNRLETNPMRQSFTGWSGYAPNATPEANDYQGILDEVGGATFLQAFNNLRGGGAITEAEGAKATASLSRLHNTAPSDAGFLAALKDTREVMQEILTNVRKRAGISAQPTSAPPPSVAPNPNDPLGILGN